MNLKSQNCEFFWQQIQFLGRVITPSGMSINASKLKALRWLPIPCNRKDLESFVGFCNFYGKFAKNHAFLMSQLIDSLKKIPISVLKLKSYVNSM